MKSINKTGFTLIELIFVIVILGIIGSTVISCDVKNTAVSIETKTTVSEQSGTTKWE